jgi:hypothetical protein
MDKECLFGQRPPSFGSHWIEARPHDPRGRRTRVFSIERRDRKKTQPSEKSIKGFEKYK